MRGLKPLFQNINIVCAHINIEESKDGIEKAEIGIMLNNQECSDPLIMSITGKIYKGNVAGRCTLPKQKWEGCNDLDLNIMGKIYTKNYELIIEMTILLSELLPETGKLEEKQPQSCAMKIRGKLAGMPDDTRPNDIPCSNILYSMQDITIESKKMHEVNKEEQATEDASLRISSGSASSLLQEHDSRASYHEDRGPTSLHNKEPLTLGADNLHCSDNESLLYPPAGTSTGDTLTAGAMVGCNAEPTQSTVIVPMNEYATPSYMPTREISTEEDQITEGGQSKTHPPIGYYSYQFHEYKGPVQEPKQSKAHPPIGYYLYPFHEYKGPVQEPKQSKAHPPIAYNSYRAQGVMPDAITSQMISFLKSFKMSYSQELAVGKATEEDMVYIVKNLQNTKEVLSLVKALIQAMDKQSSSTESAKFLSEAMAMASRTQHFMYGRITKCKDSAGIITLDHLRALAARSNDGYLMYIYTTLLFAQNHFIPNVLKQVLTLYYKEKDASQLPVKDLPTKDFIRQLYFHLEKQIGMMNPSCWGVGSWQNKFENYLCSNESVPESPLLPRTYAGNNTQNPSGSLMMPAQEDCMSCTKSQQERKFHDDQDRPCAKRMRIEGACAHELEGAPSYGSILPVVGQDGESIYRDSMEQHRAPD